MKPKVKLLRFRVFLRNIWRRYTSKKDSLSLIQKKTVNIVKFLIAKESSTLLISPISNVYHIENGNVFVRLDEQGCYVMNSVYSYYVYIPSEETNKIIIAFNRKMERKTGKTMSIYEQKTLKNLDDIIFNLNSIS